jgi:hypothetical protein
MLSAHARVLANVFTITQEPPATCVMAGLSTVRHAACSHMQRERITRTEPAAALLPRDQPGLELSVSCAVVELPSGEGKVDTALDGRASRGL